MSDVLEITAEAPTSYMSGSKNPSTIGKRAAIYARVSTVEQAEEGYSIEAQLKSLREVCEAKGFELIEEYVDGGISG